jgi:hypothetical protein
LVQARAELAEDFEKHTPFLKAIKNQRLDIAPLPSVAPASQSVLSDWKLEFVRSVDQYKASFERGDIKTAARALADRSRCEGSIRALELPSVANDVISGFHLGAHQRVILSRTAVLPFNILWHKEDIIKRSVAAIFRPDNVPLLWSHERSQRFMKDIGQPDVEPSVEELKNFMREVLLKNSVTKNWILLPKRWRPFHAKILCRLALPSCMNFGRTVFFRERIC